MRDVDDLRVHGRDAITSWLVTYLGSGRLRSLATDDWRWPRKAKDSMDKQYLCDLIAMTLAVIRTYHRIHTTYDEHQLSRLEALHYFERLLDKASLDAERTESDC